MNVAPSRRFFIQACNVHQGGGATLLRALLEAPIDAVSVYVQIDERMHLARTPRRDVVVRKVRANLWRRLMAERWLAQSAQGSDMVLCFGNLPPMFRTSARVVVFLQNRYLVDSQSLAAFPLQTRLRLQVERWWLRWCVANADVFAVQTPSMAAALQTSGLAANKQVLVLPFVANAAGYERSECGIDGTSQPAEADIGNAVPAGSARPFLYVASGEPHKNHRNLIMAWCLLASEDLFPMLWLTLDSSASPVLCEWLDAKREEFSLQMHNWGKLPHDAVVGLYTRSHALIYPSTFESFGLPLVEARQAGLPVIASELDFVRDVLDPEEVFDPTSPRSIARAVKRFLGRNEHPLPLMTASDFFDRIFKDWR